MLRLETASLPYPTGLPSYSADGPGSCFLQPETSVNLWVSRGGSKELNFIHGTAIHPRVLLMTSPSRLPPADEIPG